MKQFYHLLISTSLLFLLACNEDEIEATVPAYLKIDNISVDVQNSSNQGSASSKIVDAWVFVNDQLIGAFELPAIIPILHTGNVNVKVRGGIYNNGLSNQREIYPFYEFYNLDTVLVPEVVYEPNIEVEYKQEAVFNDAFDIEDFETGISFINNPNNDTNIVRVTEADKVFEGNASGGIFLEPGTRFAEIYTPNFSNVPRNGTAVYMELNYRSTHNFAISLYVNNQSQQFSVVNFRASTEWNKVYVEFSDAFSNLFSANNFSIAIGIAKPLNDNSELLLDNIKLINY